MATDWPCFHRSREDETLITDRPISLEDALDGLDAASGAVVTFAGIVRDHNEGRAVRSIHYDCYRSMANREISRLVKDVKSRIPVRSVRVVHRVGELRVGETSLVVVAVGAHRSEAFDACRELVEGIKRRVPIWKQEHYEDGTSRWL